MKILTVNLEEKLINSKKATIEKLNKENEINDSLLSQVQNILNKDNKSDIELLKKFGFEQAIEIAHDLKNKSTHINNKLNNVKSERIFTIDEIKSIAIKYGLRFLPAQLYTGFLPPELPQKIKEFENLDLDVESEYKSGFGLSYTDKVSYYILAPKDSFKLQEKPKDPLLFAKLKSGDYYLIHKWGDDLSITNYVKNIFCRNEFTKRASSMVFYFLLALSFLFLICKIDMHAILIVITGVFALFAIILGAHSVFCEFDGFDGNNKTWDTNK